MKFENKREKICFLCALNQIVTIFRKRCWGKKNAFFFLHIFSVSLSERKADLNIEYTINYEFLRIAFDLESSKMLVLSALCYTFFSPDELMLKSDNFFSRCFMLRFEQLKFKLVSCRFIYSLWFRVQLVLSFPLVASFCAHRNNYWLCSVWLVDLMTTQNRFEFFFKKSEMPHKKKEIEKNKKLHAVNMSVSHYCVRIPLL